MLSFDDLLDGFGRCGVLVNDLVMVHSSYKSLGGVQGGAETVVQALQELTAPVGSTLFFPRYGVKAWCENHYWDIGETPGEMGIIPEMSARAPGAWRTSHPIHSFEIVGPYRPEFIFENRSSFDVAGPFGLFHRMDGLVISFGVDWSHTFSFVHYVEQQNRAPWRREKAFAGTYIDSWGAPSLRTYYMSVRARPWFVTDVDDLYDAVLIPQGVVSQTHVGAATVSWFRCQDYYQAVSDMVKTNPHYFYREASWRE